MKQIQCYDGDGIEPVEVKRARLRREQELRNEQITKERLEREQKEAKLYAKQLFKDRQKKCKETLRINCFRFTYGDIVGNDVELKITTDDVDQFSDILTIRPPDVEVVYPPFNPMDPMRMPVARRFIKPVFGFIKTEEVSSAFAENDALYTITLRFTHSGITDFSKEIRAGWDKLNNLAGKLDGQVPPKKVASPQDGGTPCLPQRSRRHRQKGLVRAR